MSGSPVGGSSNWVARVDVDATNPITASGAGAPEVETAGALVALFGGVLHSCAERGRATTLDRAASGGLRLAAGLDQYGPEWLGRVRGEFILIVVNRQKRQARV